MEEAEENLRRGKAAIQDVYQEIKHEILDELDADRRGYERESFSKTSIAIDSCLKGRDSVQDAKTVETALAFESPCEVCPCAMGQVTEMIRETMGSRGNYLIVTGMKVDSTSQTWMQMKGNWDV